MVTIASIYSFFFLSEVQRKRACGTFLVVYMDDDGIEFYTSVCNFCVNIYRVPLVSHRRSIRFILWFR